MSKKLLLVGLVGVLLVVSVFQAFQLNGLNEKLNDVKEEGLVASASSQVQTQAQAPTPKPQGQSGVPQNLQNLPQMVGGC
ncbi:MAG: hypothetical protein ACE5DI_03815 [Candidatus Micrarchaeia archaeon]